MKYPKLLFVPLLAICFLYCCSSRKIDTISLSGEWMVKLDSADIGAGSGWAAQKLAGTAINLPGTLDDAGIGTVHQLTPEMNNSVLSHLTRKHHYIGKAWYQKEIEIPASWEGKDIELGLERIIWESTVYIDGEFVGTSNSLIGSHDYDLTYLLTPGKHLLTICIDNSNKFPNINVAGTKYPDPVNQDLAHAYTNHTQIKWNGIIGKMQLTASNKNTPSNLQVYPDIQKNTLRVTFDQKGQAGEPIRCIIRSPEGKTIFDQTVKSVESGAGVMEFEINRPETLAFWDEFNPHLYDLELTTDQGAVRTRFGYRVLGNNNGNLMLNGKRIFLRGNLECVIFPLTGYPPLEKEGWETLIAQAKDYGLNHLRFHSWCPPKAAFEAADEAGFYYQVELPHWSLKVGEDENTTAFLSAEAHKIIKDYGNHPSFIFMALGNELEGDADLLNSMVQGLKAQDNRHLYATTAFSFQRPMGVKPEPEDDFFVTQWTDKGWIRGQGIFNDKPPHFNVDYSAGSDHINVPLISHEIGQYSVYPDLREISKYTGTLEPLNFIAIKEDLTRKGLLDLAPDFTYNSGKLAALLYKEEIERALKTPGFDGFQLLQLQDFPGQGTALVGLLNAFWESKGIISAEEFSQFNSELVPLIRFEKAVYESGETFNATIEIANFFEEKENQRIDWTITDDGGTVIKDGQLIQVDLSIGNNRDIGAVVLPIEVDQAQRLTITVSLRGTKYKNSWSIWVYPKAIPTGHEQVIVTASFEQASTALNQGKTVLLNPDYKTLQGVEGRFVPVFWSPVHFPNQPASMGLLMDDKHPAFDSFPTNSHTDWQWWDLCIHSKSVVIDSLHVTPIVRVIDNFVTNRHLANVFEAKVGQGKLIFSSIDLISNLDRRPVARQLRHSLSNYMASGQFNPTKTITIEDLKNMKLNQTDSAFSATDIYD